MPAASHRGDYRSVIFGNKASGLGQDQNPVQPLPRRKSGFRLPDFRFLIGVLLIGASIAGVFTVLNLANKGIQILTATRTLLPGELVVEGDLQPLTINADRLSADYLLAGSIPESGLIATRVIMAGEFVPKSALGSAASESYTSIVIELANKIPGSIGPGSVVDLWSTAKSDSEFEPPVVLVGGATIVRVVESEGLVRDQGNNVEILIPRDKVARVLEALSTGAEVAIVPVSLPIGG